MTPKDKLPPRDPGTARIDDKDMQLWPHGDATFMTTKEGTRIYVFSGLDDLSPEVRKDATHAAQMAGLIGDVEPDPNLVKLIDC